MQKQNDKDIPDIFPPYYASYNVTFIITFK